MSLTEAPAKPTTFETYIGTNPVDIMYNLIGWFEDNQRNKCDVKLVDATLSTLKYYKSDDSLGLREKLLKGMYATILDIEYHLYARLESVRLKQNTLASELQPYPAERGFRAIKPLEYIKSENYRFEKMDEQITSFITMSQKLGLILSRVNLNNPQCVIDEIIEQLYQLNDDYVDASGSIVIPCCDPFHSLVYGGELAGTLLKQMLTDAVYNPMDPVLVSHVKNSHRNRQFDNRLTVAIAQLRKQTNKGAPSCFELCVAIYNCLVTLDGILDNMSELIRIDHFITYGGISV